MAFYEYTGGDPRDYFHLGRVNHGDVREFTVPPDVHWRPASKATASEPVELADEPADDDVSAVDDVPAAPIDNEEVV